MLSPGDVTPSPTAEEVSASQPSPAPPTPSPTAMAVPSPIGDTPTPVPTPVVTPTPCAPSLGINLPQREPVVSIAPPAWLAHAYLFDWALCGFRFTATVLSGAGWLEVLPGEGVVEGSEMTPLSLAVRAEALPGTGEGLFTGRVLVDAGAAGSLTLDVQVTNVGTPPIIESAEALCLPESLLLVRVRATDDYGIVSGYARAGTSSAPLAQQEDGTWVSIVDLERPVPAAITVFLGLYDAAGQVAQRQVTAPCPPPP